MEQNLLPVLMNPSPRLFDRSTIIAGDMMGRVNPLQGWASLVAHARPALEDALVPVVQSE